MADPFRIVDVPGLGEVEFPSSMSDAEIQAVLARQPGAPGQTQTGKRRGIRFDVSTPRDLTNLSTDYGESTPALAGAAATLLGAGGGLRAGVGAIRSLAGTRIGGALAAGGAAAAAKIPILGPMGKAGAGAALRAFRASAPVQQAAPQTLAQLSQQPFSPAIRNLIADPAQAMREGQVDQLAKFFASRMGTINATGPLRDALMRMLSGGQ